MSLAVLDVSRAKALWQGCLSGLLELTLQDELQLPLKSWHATNCIPTCVDADSATLLCCSQKLPLLISLSWTLRVLTCQWLEVAWWTVVQACGLLALADASGRVIQLRVQTGLTRREGKLM